MNSAVQFHSCDKKITGSYNFKNDSYCSSCDKVIHDFSQFNQEELLQVIRQAGGNTCGKINPAQVSFSTAVDTTHLQHKFSWKYVLATVAALFISIVTLAQVKNRKVDIVGKMVLPKPHVIKPPVKKTIPHKATRVPASPLPAHEYQTQGVLTVRPSTSDTLIKPKK